MTKESTNERRAMLMTERTTMNKPGFEQQRRRRGCKKNAPVRIIVAIRYAPRSPLLGDCSDEICYL
jgi:hypothetical protein